jgi:hypothetical protein
VWFLAACVPLTEPPTGSDDDDSADVAVDDDDATPDGPFEEACALPPTPATEGWTGPIFDTHVHTTIFPGVTQEEFATRLLDEMNRAGVERAVVVGPHFVHFANNLSWLRDLEADWGDLVSRCGRLEYQLGGFDPDDPDAVNYVSQRLDEAPFAGVGSLDLRHDFSNSEPDAAGLPAVLDLLEARGLPFQFHGITNTDDVFIDRMIAIVDARPTLPFVWFGCPDAVLFAPPRDNLACAMLPFSLVCPAPCDGPDRQALEHAVVGLDIGPVGFNPWDEGSSPFPYESFEGGIAQARAALGELPEDVATSIAYGRFEGTY